MILQNIVRSHFIGDQRRDKEETLLNVQYVFRSPLIGDPGSEKRPGRDVFKCTVCFQITLNWGSKKR